MDKKKIYNVININNKLKKMLKLLNEILLKKEKTIDDVIEIEKQFLSEIEVLNAIEGIEKMGIDLKLLSKLSYYKTMINLSKSNINAINLLIPELIKDFNTIKDLNDKSKENLKLLNGLKKQKNMFIENDEIIFSTKSDKFGYFISITKGEHLRTINLTSNANGYHLHSNGSFCSGNTFSTLKDLLVGKQNIFLYIVFLRKILTNYDDGKHHLAKPKDFDLWKNFQKKDIEKKEEMKKIFLKKSNYIIKIQKELKVSKKGLEFILKQIEIIKKELFI